MKDEDVRALCIAKFGEEGFKQANEAAAAALTSLMAATTGHTLESVANAAGLLFAAVVKADGGKVEQCLSLLTACWDSQTVERLATLLHMATLPEAIGES